MWRCVVADGQVNNCEGKWNPESIGVVDFIDGNGIRLFLAVFFEEETERIVPVDAKDEVEQIVD